MKFTTFHLQPPLLSITPPKARNSEPFTRNEVSLEQAERCGLVDGQSDHSHSCGIAARFTTDQQRKLAEPL